MCIRDSVMTSPTAPQPPQRWDLRIYLLALPVLRHLIPRKLRHLCLELLERPGIVDSADRMRTNWLRHAPIELDLSNYPIRTYTSTTAQLARSAGHGCGEIDLSVATVPYSVVRRCHLAWKTTPLEDQP